MSKFTPGPWQLHRGFSDWGMPCQHDVFVGEDENPEQIAAIPSVTPYCLGASGKDRDLASRHWADARLIAAAPEIYEALRMALEVLHTAPMVGGAYHARRITEATKAAEAAIAKADGAQ